MAETDVFKHSTPSLYDRYMGPLLFEPYARYVAERVRTCAREGSRVEAGAGEAGGDGDDDGRRSGTRPPELVDRPRSNSGRPWIADVRDVSLAPFREDGRWLAYEPSARLATDMLPHTNRAAGSETEGRASPGR